MSYTPQIGTPKKRGAGRVKKRPQKSQQRVCRTRTRRPEGPDGAVLELRQRSVSFLWLNTTALLLSPTEKRETV